jgi:hypothetical protein
MVTRFAASLRTDNCPQPKEARPLSHALTSDSNNIWTPAVALNWLFPHPLIAQQPHEVLTTTPGLIIHAYLDPRHPGMYPAADRATARYARGRDTPTSILVTATLHPTHAPPSHAQENNPRNSHSLATTPWFTITGTHMLITSGTSTVMTQHHLHHVDGSTPTAPHCL